MRKKVKGNEFVGYSVALAFFLFLLRFPLHSDTSTMIRKNRRIFFLFALKTFSFHPSIHPYLHFHCAVIFLIFLHDTISDGGSTAAAASVYHEIIEIINLIFLEFSYSYLDSLTHLSTREFPISIQHYELRFIVNLR